MNNLSNSVRPKIRVSIIEDNIMYSNWLKMVLAEDKGLELTSVNALGREGIESVKIQKSDVVLLDFQLNDMTGFEVIKRVKAHNNKIKVFIMTALVEVSILERFFNDKNIDAITIKGSHYLQHNLLSAINHVADGGAYLDPSLLTKIRESSRSTGLSALTKREFEIFIQINTGKSDEEVANDLCVEISYIKNIKSKIIKKVSREEIGNIKHKLIDNKIVND